MITEKGGAAYSSGRRDVSLVAVKWNSKDARIDLRNVRGSVGD
jgi:hypothetical protein